MKSGLKPLDAAEVDRVFQKRMAAAGGGRSDKATYLALRAIAEDFDGLEDVRGVAAQATTLGREKAIRAALKQDEDEDDREERMLRDIWRAEGRLTTDDRLAALAELARRWKNLSESGKKADDSAERRLARRVLGGLSASVNTKDTDYLAIIAEYRMGRGGR